MNPRVEAGVEWLNENRPGWYNEIDLDRLDIYSEKRCIIGQLYGRYDYDVDYIPEELNCIEVRTGLGFACGSATNQQWVDAILKLRTATQ